MRFYKALYPALVDPLLNTLGQAFFPALGSLAFQVFVGNYGKQHLGHVRQENAFRCYKYNQSCHAGSDGNEDVQRPAGISGSYDFMPGYQS